MDLQMSGQHQLAWIQHLLSGAPSLHNIPMTNPGIRDLTGQHLGFCQQLMALVDLDLVRPDMACQDRLCMPSSNRVPAGLLATHPLHMHAIGQVVWLSTLDQSLARLMTSTALSLQGDALSLQMGKRLARLPCA